MPEREQRVTPLELFFDLVFVFGITQVTGMMSDDPTWTGLGRGLLVLAALWWAWTGYAWLTNELEPEEVPVRAAMFAAMAALLVVALAVPGSFGEDGVLFGVAYLVVRLLFLRVYTLAARDDPELRRAVLRMLPPAVGAPMLLVLAGFLDGRAQATLWLVALAADYLGVLVGRGEGWHVSPAHFAERHGLIVIIALGESVVAIGIGAAALELTTGTIAAGVLGVAAIAALWWAYFDVHAVMAQRRLEALGGAARVRLARDLYSYLHLPMIAGVVLFALGLKKTLEHVDEALATVPALALCGGLALFFLSHVALRIRVVHSVRRTTRGRPGWLGRGRPLCTLALALLAPAALELPALTSLALATAVCCAVIVYDVVHYREERASIRAARP